MVEFLPMYFPFPQPTSMRRPPRGMASKKSSTFGHGECRVSLKWPAISSYTCKIHSIWITSIKFAFIQVLIVDHNLVHVRYLKIPSLCVVHGHPLVLLRVTKLGIPACQAWTTPHGLPESKWDPDCAGDEGQPLLVEESVVSTTIEPWTAGEGQVCPLGNFFLFPFH